MVTVQSEEHAKAFLVVYSCGRDSPDVGSTLFEVRGAGFLSFNGPSYTGGVSGLSLDASWSRHGYSGGVIGWGEVEALRDFLTQKLAERDQPHPHAVIG